MTALSVTTGSRSLVALGLSLSDIAALVSLAQKFGNWVSADADGRQLLELLDLDELSIFGRQGLIDPIRFNHIWGSRLYIMVGNQAQEFEDENIVDSLGKMSRFTAIMVCLTAALEAFASQNVVKDTLKRVLVGLLSTTDFGQEVLNSKFRNLFNGWQATATSRTLSLRARVIRRKLLEQGIIQEGLMPASDMPATEHFLLWLLNSHEQTYTTSSSDIAGVGLCLSRLGIDILGVKGLAEEPENTPCVLIYDKNAISEAGGHGILSPSPLFRVSSTTVNLKSPEESLTKFPTERTDTGLQCRRAWKEGAKAAEKIACSPVPIKSNGEMAYAFVNRGSEPERTKDEIYNLAVTHAFGVNQELLESLGQALHDQTSPELEWLIEQTRDHVNITPDISKPDFRDRDKVGAFTVFQAFFMGYYYAIFLRLVDTSMLQFQIVEGAWGFRSPGFLKLMSTRFCSRRPVSSGTRLLARGEVIYILAKLFCGTVEPIAQIYPLESGAANLCTGVIGRRALLARSLISPCRTIQDVGMFVLLDCDVSGIPRDKNGFVRPGISELDLYDYRVLTKHHDSDFPKTVSEDVTFHIEPDWDRDEETIVVCIRYKGRRVTTINPCKADSRFCFSLVQPMSSPMELKSEVHEWAAGDVLNLKELPRDLRQPILVRVSNLPRLQYAATAIFGAQAPVRLATNCIATAVEQGALEARREGPNVWHFVIIAGDGMECQAKPEDWVYIPLPTAGHDRQQVENLPRLRAERGHYGTEGWRDERDY